MKPLCLLVFLLLACVSKNARSQEKLTVPPAHTLDSRNFDTSIRDGSVWLIEFYAPWCGHCQNFKTEYEGVALILHQEHDSVVRKVKVATIDGDAEKAISSRFSIRGYPSFFLVDGWRVYEYDGNRARDALVDFAKKGYKEYEPIPFPFSPMGPLGQLQGLLMFAGTRVMDIFDWMNNSLGLSPVVAGGLLCGAVIMVSLVSMIFLAILVTPKHKED